MKEECGALEQGDVVASDISVGSLASSTKWLAIP
jgi:hypothetical protein